MGHGDWCDPARQPPSRSSASSPLKLARSGPDQHYKASSCATSSPTPGAGVRRPRRLKSRGRGCRPQTPELRTASPSTRPTQDRVAGPRPVACLRPPTSRSAPRAAGRDPCLSAPRATGLACVHARTTVVSLADQIRRGARADDVVLTRCRCSTSTRSRSRGEPARGDKPRSSAASRCQLLARGEAHRRRWSMLGSPAILIANAEDHPDQGSPARLRGRRCRPTPTGVAAALRLRTFSVGYGSPRRR